MLISLLGVGLLLMGVGYNPTPIASGVKYTQNKTQRNEKIEIERNYEYDGKQPFSIQATNLISDQETYNYELDLTNYKKRTYIQKQKRQKQENVGLITTYTYQQRALYTENNAWEENRYGYYYLYQNFQYGYKDSYDINQTFDIATIQLDPYSNLFDTTANIKLNVYLNDLLWWNQNQATYTNYAVWTNISIYVTTSNQFDTYFDIANWYSSQTIYQEMWNAVNTTTEVMNYYHSNSIVNYNADGTAQQTGENRNNRTDEIQIDIVPNKTNRIFVFTKPFLIAPISNAPADSVLHTSTDQLHTQFMQLINPTIAGYYIAGAINYEVVDIPGMMWEILTMPFSFISVAFNLTLFPGTPYQVNISNLFLVVFGIMVVIWILGRVKKVI